MATNSMQNAHRNTVGLCLPLPFCVLLVGSGNEAADVATNDITVSSKVNIAHIGEIIPNINKTNTDINNEVNETVNGSNLFVIKSTSLGTGRTREVLCALLGKLGI